MQLRHLRYFIAVAEEGSVLKAARRLHVAQPAVSKQIQDLEKEVGCPLFERLARGVRLTPPGEVFLREARSTVENAARAIASARRAQHEASNTLHFAAGRLTYFPVVLADLLATYRASHPTVGVRIHKLGERNQKLALRERRVDVAANWVAHLPVTGFESHAFLDARLRGVLIPARHPLAQQEDVSLSQLQPLVRLHRPRPLSDDLYRGLRSALLARGLPMTHHRAITADVTTVTMNMAAGDCYMLASDLTARDYEGNDVVVYRRFREPAIPVWLALFWSGDASLAFVQGLLEAAEVLKEKARRVGDAILCDALGANPEFAAPPSIIRQA